MRLKTKEVLRYYIKKIGHYGHIKHIATLCGVSRNAPKNWGEYVPLRHTKTLQDDSGNKFKEYP